MPTWLAILLFVGGITTVIIGGLVDLEPALFGGMSAVGVALLFGTTKSKEA